jgi:hypothetical protein
MPTSWPRTWSTNVRKRWPSWWLTCPRIARPSCCRGCLARRRPKCCGAWPKSLAAHQPELAARFAPPAAELSLAFDDLAGLPELALAKIIAECEVDVLLLGLAGGHPSFARRVLDQLPARDAHRLRQQLDGLGPTRLSDVERAQQDVVATARRLHAQGSIELGARRALSLTV